MIIMEISALNHIILFEDGNLREMFDGGLWMKVVNSIEKQFVLYQLSNDDILRCHMMSRVMFLGHVENFLSSELKNS